MDSDRGRAVAERGRGREDLDSFGERVPGMADRPKRWLVGRQRQGAEGSKDLDIGERERESG